MEALKSLIKGLSEWFDTFVVNAQNNSRALDFQRRLKEIDIDAAIAGDDERLIEFVTAINRWIGKLPESADDMPDEVLQLLEAWNGMPTALIEDWGHPSPPDLEASEFGLFWQLTIDMAEEDCAHGKDAFIDGLCLKTMPDSKCLSCRATYLLHPGEWDVHPDVKPLPGAGIVSAIEDIALRPGKTDVANQKVTIPYYYWESLRDALGLDKATQKIIEKEGEGLPHHKYPRGMVPTPIVDDDLQRETERQEKVTKLIMHCADLVYWHNEPGRGKCRENPLKDCGLMLLIRDDLKALEVIESPTWDGEQREKGSTVKALPHNKPSEETERIKWLKLDIKDREAANDFIRKALEDEKRKAEAWQAQYLNVKDVLDAEKSKAKKWEERAMQADHQGLDICAQRDNAQTDLKLMDEVLAAEVERRENAEKKLIDGPWPVAICPDCDGAGEQGKNAEGKFIACETCGGNEDSLGRGWIKSIELQDAIKSVEASEARVKVLTEEAEKFEAESKSSVQAIQHHLGQREKAEGDRDAAMEAHRATDENWKRRYRESDRLLGEQERKTEAAEADRKTAVANEIQALDDVKGYAKQLDDVEKELFKGRGRIEDLKSSLEDANATRRVVSIERDDAEAELKECKRKLEAGDGADHQDVDHWKRKSVNRLLHIDRLEEAMAQRNTRIGLIETELHQARKSIEKLTRMHSTEAARSTEAIKDLSDCEKRGKELKSEAEGHAYRANQAEIKVYSFKSELRSMRLDRDALAIKVEALKASAAGQKIIKVGLATGSVAREAEEETQGGEGKERGFAGGSWEYPGNRCTICQGRTLVHRSYALQPSNDKVFRYCLDCGIRDRMPEEGMTERAEEGTEVHGRAVASSLRGDEKTSRGRWEARGRSLWLGGEWIASCFYGDMTKKMTPETASRNVTELARKLNLFEAMAVTPVEPLEIRRADHGHECNVSGCRRWARCPSGKVCTIPPGDGMGYGQCERCREANEPEGGLAGGQPEDLEPVESGPYRTDGSNLYKGGEWIVSFYREHDDGQRDIVQAQALAREICDKLNRESRLVSEMSMVPKREPDHHRHLCAHADCTTYIGCRPILPGMKECHIPVYTRGLRYCSLHPQPAPDTEPKTWTHTHRCHVTACDTPVTCPDREGCTIPINFKSDDLCGPHGGPIGVNAHSHWCAIYSCHRYVLCQMTGCKGFSKTHGLDRCSKHRN